MDECEMKRDDSIPNAEGLNIKPNFIVHGSDGDDEGETEWEQEPAQIRINAAAS